MLLRLRGKPNQCRRWLLTLLSRPSTVEMGNSYTSNGHSILGKISCWYNHTLNFPRRPDLSTQVSQLSSCSLVALMEAASFKEQSKVFPRLFKGFSVTDGRRVPPRSKWNRSNTFPLFRTKDLDFSSAQVVSLSKPRRIHLHPGTDNVVTVRSSMNALIGWRLPDLVLGPLHSGSADLTSDLTH